MTNPPKRPHRRSLAFYFCLIAANLLTLGIARGESPPWWNRDFSLRVPVLVRAAKEVERNFPVQVNLDFSQLSEGAALDPSAIRVVECDPTTGKVLGEAPALFLPLDASKGTPVTSPWPAPYPVENQPKVRASSESPQNPAANVADRWTLFRPTTWEPSSPEPPWILSLDFGKPTWINSLWAMYPGHPSTQHCPYRADFEVAAESEDGLVGGTWEKVGGWDPDNGRLFGQYRVACFAPRKVQCARLVVRESSGVPWIDDFRALAPLSDPEKKSAGTVNWIAEGETSADKPRLFTIYFGAPEGAKLPPNPAPTRIGVLREAETSVYSIHGIGFSSGVRTEANASGGKEKNLLSCPKWEMPHAALLACFPITLPAAGKWSLHLRARGNLKEHPINVLLDNHPFFSGTFSTEGTDWSILSLPAAEIAAGVHYLEIYLFDTQNQPLDLDYALLTNDEKFLPQGYLKIEVGAADKRS